LTSKTNPPNDKVALSVVIPLYNEQASLRELYQEIRRICEEKHLVWEIVFVDDGSTDDSFQVLEDLHNSDPNVKALQFRQNVGKSEALSAGFQAASGKWIVTMDADLQDDPAEIPRLLEKLEPGYDVVSGWKKKRRDPISRRFLSRIYNRVTGWLTGLRIHDMNCGLKIYRQEVVRSLNIYGELHRYIPVLAHREGFRVGEIPVNHRARKYGRSKYGMSRIVKGLLDLITVLFLSRYTRRPLHLFGALGLLFTLAGGGITLYLVILRITRMVYLSNRPLLFIGVLLIIVGIQFVSIGLLGEMITRSHASGHIFKIRKSLGV
jgi:glycosyltransferase involved in cell wall biosynthesis